MSMYVCMFVSMYVFIYVCMCVCMYVYMHAFMHACNIFIYIYRERERAREERALTSTYPASKLSQRTALFSNHHGINSLNFSEGAKKEAQQS